MRAIATGPPGCADRGPENGPVAVRMTTPLAMIDGEVATFLKGCNGSIHRFGADCEFSSESDSCDESLAAESVYMRHDGTPYAMRSGASSESNVSCSTH